MTTAAAYQLRDAILQQHIGTVDDLLRVDQDLLRTFLPEPCAWGDEQWLAFHYAARVGDASVLQVLLRHGAVVDCRTRFRSPLHARETALSIAAHRGHTPAVATLLEHGAEPEVRDANNLSPLAHAAHGGYAGLVDLLIQHAVAVDPVCDQQRTPLHDAILGSDPRNPRNPRNPQSLQNQVEGDPQVGGSAAATAPRPPPPPRLITRGVRRC